ncbi:MAG TPA: acetylornithine/succinylornithine family transaminase [Kofleriaceae bacterium]|nr:acetylornithine/succinylornithine family transaminase [Kofleriaceae bacterium]
MSYTQAELLVIGEHTFLRNYRQQPIVLTRGEGANVWDADGRRYLDMTAGIAVCCLGHAHPELTARLAAQLGRLTHVSNLYWNDQQILAAKEIVSRSFGQRVFFCNSGAEANEAAIKLARRYQQQVAQSPGRTTLVSTIGSFHGRSVATVSITGQAKYREGFGPLFEPVQFVPYGDLEAARGVLETGTACAMIVEPIQAEGGLVVPPAGYLRGLRELCDETGTLLVFDEVQTGVGRTGKWWGHLHDDVTPDVMTLAKGLGGGVPIGAMVATDKAAAGLTFTGVGAVPHASTFGGNPLATCAAQAVLEIIERDRLLDRVTETGHYLGERLAGLVADFPGVALEARGRGLLRGLRVAAAASQVVGRARELGVLLSLAGADVVRFAPAYIIGQAEVDEAVGVLAQVLAEGVAGKPVPHTGTASATP